MSDDTCYVSSTYISQIIRGTENFQEINLKICESFYTTRHDVVNFEQTRVKIFSSSLQKTTNVMPHITIHANEVSYQSETIIDQLNLLLLIIDYLNLGIFSRIFITLACTYVHVTICT